MKFGLLISAAALFGAASLWMLLAEPPPRIPPGWSWQSNFVGTLTPPDPQTGELPEEDVLAVYKRTIAIESGENRPQSIVLEDELVIRDPITGEVTWRYTVHPKVDPATGRHLEPQGTEDRIVFPRGVERRPYRLRMNYIEGVPLSFRGEETVEGLDVWRFGYKGRGEYTDSYAGTEDYAGVPVEPGQEIRCADDQFTVFVWVEPLTGEVAKMAEHCLSGDYVFDIATGERGAAVLRWGGETAGIDVLGRVEWVRGERRRLLLRRYMPFVLGGLALALGAAAVLVRRRPA